MAMIVSAFFSPLTERGIHEAKNWRAFSEYLREVTREKEPVTHPDLFESNLPYAASFGIGEAWSKFFQKHGGSGLPPWFQALSNSRGAGGEAGMAAFVAMMAASCAAGSNSAGTTGGGGAAGGGSSGAG
jgi:uncharacterized membrane protein